MILKNEPFDLAWYRQKLHLTKAEMANAIGYSIARYRALEARNAKTHKCPCEVANRVRVVSDRIGRAAYAAALIPWTACQ